MLWSLFFLLSMGAAALGVLFLSQATMGVGLICGACLLAIYSRIAQASAYQIELKNLLEDKKTHRRLKQESEQPIMDDEMEGP